MGSEYNILIVYIMKNEQIEIDCMLLTFDNFNFFVLEHWKNSTNNCQL